MHAMNDSDSSDIHFDWRVKLWNASSLLSFNGHSEPETGAMLVLVLAPTGLSQAPSVFRRSLQKRTNTNNNKILRAPYCFFFFFFYIFFLFYYMS